MNARQAIFFISATLILQSCFTVKSNEHFTYRKLRAAEYAQMLDSIGDHHLIDVRTGGEYRHAHMRGAKNLNFLAFHYGRDIDTLDRSKTAFIYCQTCHRSPFAARIMKHKGFKCVYDLKGGFAQWTKASLKTETGN